MTNFRALYTEAVEVSNAAESFASLVDFETTKVFVEEVQKAQESLVEHILSCAEAEIISAAAAGLKYATVFEFKGSDLHEDFNILFMLFGGVDQDRRDQLAQFGFSGCYEDLMKRVEPFYIKHSWDRATNNNSITLFWE
ncbi:hypothetical protein ATCVGM07011_163L [Acanthocystis turfacea Chlorella virus GM0701.1]|nr:hypothetical protein ATCVGM07011_163L [Acanthocystis turfacea Chlorella virus GM0701.1]